MDPFKTKINPICNYKKNKEIIDIKGSSFNINILLNIKDRFSSETFPDTPKK